MVSTTAVRRWAAATSTTLLLLTGAACSSDSPSPTPSSAAPAPSGPATAAPGPKETPSSTLPPPATTPVPQRSPGDIGSTVPTTPEKTTKPVDLDESSSAGNGISARLSSVKAVTAKATGPGEVAGPALALTVVVKNASRTALDLNQVVVTLDASDASPGNPMSDKPAKPFSGRLAAGRSATGVYVFTVGEDVRKPVVVNVTLAADTSVLAFTGDAP